MRRRSGLPSTGRIFGIGLSRTGTTSLNTALNLLGFRSWHCPMDERSTTELMAHYAGGGPLRLSVLDRIDAVTDSPIAAAFEALDSAYPGSKFILTTRDKQSWLRSYATFWEEFDPALIESADDPGSAPPTEEQRAEGARFVAAFHERLYGVADFDEDRFAQGYDEHLRRVREHFHDRPDALLTIDLIGGEGWEPLCEFLGVPVPAVPFPRDRWPYDGPTAKPEGLLRTLLRGASS